MSYYENRIKHLEGLVATMAREQRMKAIPVEAKLVERIAEYQAENTRLKAEVDALKLGSLLTAVDVLQFINLKAEVERLRASSFVTAVPVEEYEKLKAEVERLIYVGDMLATMVGHSEVTGDAHRMMLELSAEWQAAKEGKQP